MVNPSPQTNQTHLKVDKLLNLNIHNIVVIETECLKPQTLLICVWFWPAHLNKAQEQFSFKYLLKDCVPQHIVYCEISAYRRHTDGPFSYLSQWEVKRGDRVDTRNFWHTADFVCLHTTCYIFAESVCTANKFLILPKSKVQFPLKYQKISYCQN